MEIKTEFRKQFAPRRKDSHKGDYGRIFVLAGSRGLSGACFLTSMAALRSGAGLVTVGIPKSLVLP
ncbi:MAG: NAD(P)H-hydrate dehydratase, partial [Candidatus Omnitrophica bacterium]|nr:NAD(P)H-hydrate dehydratase [Candidatus Omnitrophota bacterium]